MIRCNGFFNGGRAILAPKTPVGRIAHSAQREMGCCAALASTVVRQTLLRLPR